MAFVLNAIPIVSPRPLLRRAVVLVFVIAANPIGHSGPSASVETTVGVTLPSSEFNVLSEPFSLNRGQPLTNHLRTQLAERAASYKTFLETFACTESVEKKSTPAKHFDYLLSVSATAPPSVEEIRFKKDSRVSARLSLPSAASWTLLFSDTYQPYFVYRYLGISVEGSHLVHKILFRGTLALDHGTDIREWEGLIAVDIHTLAPVYVEAAPRLYMEHARIELKKRRRSLRTTVGVVETADRAGGEPIHTFRPLKSIRMRRSPKIRTLAVRFTPMSSGMSLPSRMVEQEHRISELGSSTKDVEIKQYTGYRFFATRALVLRATAAGHEVD